MIRGLPCVAAAFALAAACTAGSALAQTGLDLGLDAAGDACIAVASDADSSRFSVYCGAWRAPAGELSRDASLIGDCAPSELDPELLTCPGSFSGGAILDAAGSVRGRSGEAHFRGLPASAPALRRGAAVLVGAAAPVEYPGSVSQELAARGVTALEDLRSLQRLGDSLNIAFAFAEAADAYSLSLTFLDGPFAGRVDQRADIALELALNLSGEGQFTQAAREFARADELVAIANDPALEIKRDNYVAAHLMNQGLFDAALRRLDAAPGAGGGRGRGEERAPRAADDEITVEEARAANLRARDSDGDVDPLAIGAGEALTPDEREALLFAHRAYLRGVALDVLGRDGVDEAYSQAADLLSQAPASSAIWVAALLSEKRALRDVAAGRPGQAIARVRPALEAVRGLAPRTSLEARLTSTLAEALAAQGSRDEALATFGEAFDIFGTIGAAQVGVSVERAAPYLELLLDALDDAGGNDPALLARYVAAFETIAEPAAAAAMTRSSARASAQGGARAEIRALQDAQLALRQASAALQVGAAGADEAELARLRAARAEAERAVIAAEQVVRTQAPDYQQLVARQVDVAALTQALKPGEIFVAYAASSRGGFGYAARADGSITPFRSAASRGQISAAAADLREALEESGGLREVTERGSEIYAATVGAAREALDAAGRGAGITGLAYSVRGAVGSVPPAILAAGVEADGAPHWLVRDYTSVMSAPSAAALVAARSGAERETPGGITMFGPPVRPSSEALRSLVDEECASFLEAQVYTQPITAISADDVAALGARAESGADFTTERLVNGGDLADSSVLVFSTHGFTGAQRCASEPGLLVSIGEAGAADESAEALALRDPLLTASEVVSLQLDADLVVLAACDTANMGRAGGLAAAFGSEHLDGLARAFLYAGARNVLATHWAVDDVATDAFVTRLLAEARTKPLAEAVVATQVYFLDNPDALTGGGREITPSLWGGFVLIGDGARSAATRSVSAGG
jgi:CHAT domain-containing protein